MSNSEGGSRKAALDLGDAAVGRQVRKRCGSRSNFEGQVASYDVSSRLYQVLQQNTISHEKLLAASVMKAR